MTATCQDDNNPKLNEYDVVIVGGGFTGLTAAFVLSRRGYSVKVVESGNVPGGLAGTFQFSDGVEVEKFYHHWFNSDRFVPELVEELELSDDVITLPSKTGMYLNGRMWKLSTPYELLKFSALSFWERIRLGLLVFRVRRISDWKKIEHLSIREWLEPLCGERVYQLVWEPLINSKFSIHAESVSAVWMWKKLVLRGSTRNSAGKEELAYFKGGFGRLAQALTDRIEAAGGSVSFGDGVRYVNEYTDTHSKLESLTTSAGERIIGRQFLFTPAFPIVAKIFENTDNQRWINSLRRVEYLGNICLVLRLERSLSDMYWINVNDPGFPFVGVIEHTNFDGPENYRGSHIVYLSRYLAIEDPVWSYSESDYFEFALEHLIKMFPTFGKSLVLDYRVWRAEYAQPVTERLYSEYVPDQKTPYENAHISTMAHIYPEDRGTNYAIREGREIAEKIQLMLEL